MAALAFDAIDRDPNSVLVVIEDGGEVLGTLQLTFIPGLSFQGGWRAQLEAVRIAAAHRDRILGLRSRDGRSTRPSALAVTWSR